MKLWLRLWVTGIKFFDPMISTKEYIYLDGVPVALTEINNTGIPPVVMDNDDCGFVMTGAWDLESSGSGYFGAGYRQVSPGTGTHQSFWQCNLAASEEYSVYAQWPAAPDRATNAAYTINHASGTTIVPVDQQQNGGQQTIEGQVLNLESSIIIKVDPAAPITYTATAAWTPNLAQSRTLYSITNR